MARRPPSNSARQALRRAGKLNLESLLDDSLTRRQRLFLIAYADPDSPTYLNATQSYARVYGREPDATARRNGSRTLSAAHIRPELEILLAGMGAPVGIRTMDVRRIATGKARRRTVVTRKNADGTVLERTVTDSEPTHAERLKAHEILMRVTGADAAAKAAGDAARGEYRRLMRQVSPIRDRALRRVGDWQPDDAADAGHDGRTDTDHPSPTGPDPSLGDDADPGPADDPSTPGPTTSPPPDASSRDQDGS